MHECRPGIHGTRRRHADPFHRKRDAAATRSRRRRARDSPWGRAAISRLADSTRLSFVGRRRSCSRPATRRRRAAAGSSRRRAASGPPLVSSDLRLCERERGALGENADRREISRQRASDEIVRSRRSGCPARSSARRRRDRRSPAEATTCRAGVAAQHARSRRSAMQRFTLVLQGATSRRTP